MNTFVTILRRPLQSDYDTHVGDWEEIGSAWLKLSPQRPTETLEGDQITDVRRFMAETRYNPAMQPGVQLWSKDGRNWDVHTVLDRGDHHDMMDLMLTESTHG